MTRQELYELVWSQPMQSLAKTFGISDVALAKRCRAVDVPVPPRGYWARKAAGQQPARPPLPRYRSSTNPSAPPARGAPREVLREGLEPQVGFGRPDPPLAAEDNGSLATSPEEAEFRARLVVAPPAADVTSTCAAIRRTARIQKHPLRSALPFARGERRGPVVDLDVTSLGLHRALLFADQLLRTAEGLGWTFASPTPAPETERSGGETPEPELEAGPVTGRLVVDGVPIAFHIQERRRAVPLDGKGPLARRARRANQYAPPTHRYEGTGRLKLVRLSPHIDGDRECSWYDRAKRPLEERIPEILWYFQNVATFTLKERAEAAERARAREAEERRQLLLSIRRDEHHKLVEVLERQAGAWYRARMLRRYLRALRSVVGEGRLQGKLGEEEVDFLLWAEQYVDQLDPLHAAPRVDEMMPGTGWQYRDSSELQAQMGRLLGRHWPETYKVSTCDED
jgi:hypothetical protein